MNSFYSNDTLPNFSDEENLAHRANVQKRRYEDDDGKKTLKKKKLGAPRPVAVSRRNARERKRVKLVNDGFATLRDHVPNGQRNKKLSKVETLRSAAKYIRELQSLLDGEVCGSSLVEEGLQAMVDQFPQMYDYSPSDSMTSSPSPSLQSDLSTPPHQEQYSHLDDVFSDFHQWLA